MHEKDLQNDKDHTSSNLEEGGWANFGHSESLTPHQLNQFKQYYDALISTNDQFNLTAITSFKRVLAEHFSDSLTLRKFIDFSKIQVMADVGAGAGFPALPLKIAYPHLGLILIEVTRKKQDFLRMVIEQLELVDVNICPLDWRTFLRTTEGHVDLFVSRATVDDEELARAFRENCGYRTAQVVYWAAELWEPSPKAGKYVKRVEEYQVNGKKRKLVFMAAT